MQHDAEHQPASNMADPTDRRYVESITPGAERDAVIASLAAYRAPEALQAGDPLPDVTVRRAADLEPVSVPAIHRGRPLLLVFGSFTWPPFRRRSGDVERLFQRFRDGADFAFVYIAEAHAEDEWQLPANLEEDAIVMQQTTLEQRRQQAHETAARLRLTMPLLLDEMDNGASTAFAAWPERLVVARADGRIASPGSPGPRGFSPEEAEEHLTALLGS